MNYNEIYLKGKNNYNKPAVARKYFEEALSFQKTKLKSLLQIISLDLKEGNFKHARKLIEDYDEMYKDNYKFQTLKSYLEHDEYNLKREEVILYQGLNFESYNHTMKRLGDIDIQYHRYQDAFNKFYDLLSHPEYYNKAIFSLITIHILNQEYKTPEYLLTLIDFNSLTKEELDTYKSLKIYLKFFQGKLTPKNFTNLKSQYMFYRLFDETNEELYNHLQKHKSKRPFHNDGCFLKDIDFRDLVKEAEHLIENTNPIHYLSGDKYRITLPHAIGTIDNEITKNMCVVTIINTKIILTMYPILVSKCFDKENFSHILLPNSHK